MFVVAVAEGWRLVDDAAGRKQLVVGNEAWPFPIPLVKDQRRVAVRRRRGSGRSPRAADRPQRAGRDPDLPDLRRRAAALRRQRHDGRPAGPLREAFRSDPGRQNGLYWPAQRGEKRSPLGELVAEAAQEREPLDPSRPGPVAVSRLLLRDPDRAGRRAPGGARDYVVNGEMTGGFALVAWPAQYDVTGIMTFVVTQDGIVHQKDLGEQTRAWPAR